MSVKWPNTLPQAWLNDGYQETMPNVMVRSEMDAGPAKSRRRFTAQVTPIKAQLLLTTTEKGYLETFFNTTLKGGSLSFTFPYNGSDVLRFTNPPTSTKNGLAWAVDLELEQLGIIVAPVGGANLLMETGDYLLLETGDYILLEV